VCYSAYLSDRDNLHFAKVFELFDVNQMVSYGTFQQLSERLVNSEGNVRDLVAAILNPTTGASGAASKSGKKPKQAKRILLIDEVDVFFSRSFYGETYDPALTLKHDKIAHLQHRVWAMREGDLKCILPALKETDAYKELLRDYAGVANILNFQIAKMCSDLEAWQKGGPDEDFRAYKVIDEKVAYKNGVAYDSKISFGYITLWTYFYEVESKRVPAAALEEHLGLLINCGQFSYAEIPKRYEVILGVTGTLVPEMPGGPQPLGCFEQSIIRDEYKITGRTELPSVFGERNLTFRENEVQR